MADAILETQLDYIFDLAPQIKQAIETTSLSSLLIQVLRASYQAGLGPIVTSNFTDEMLHSIIVDSIKFIKQEANSKPNTVKEALKEVKEELKQLVALAES